jgi:hypothetical protein
MSDPNNGTVVDDLGEVLYGAGLGVPTYAPQAILL